MAKKPIRVLLPLSVPITEFDDRLHYNAGEVLQAGLMQARVLNHEELRSYHFLLAIATGQRSIARFALEKAGLSEKDLLDLPVFFPNAHPHVGPIPPSYTSRQLVDAAFEEANLLSQYAVTVEHFLLAMAKRRHGRVAGILTLVGVQPDLVEKKVLSYIAPEGFPQLPTSVSSQALQA